MFKVNIEENNTTYYVWGPGELIETKKLPEYSYSNIEDTESYSYMIVPSGTKIYVLITHNAPQIISETNLFRYINNKVDETLEYPGKGSLNKKKYYGITTMPTTSITEEDYHNLFLLAKEQGTFAYPDEIQKDLEIVSKKLKKQL